MPFADRRPGVADILYVMATELEYGPELKSRITPLITGVGPIEAAIVLTEHLTRLSADDRLPMLVVSPYARRNFVDHSLTDQTSILRFIEDNWLNGERVGQGSFDAIAGPITNMFDFQHPIATRLILNPTTGQIIKK